MNIVSMTMATLSPMIVDKIAGALGITSPIVRKALHAIVPTILGGLLASTSKPGGIDALGKALGGVDTAILGKLGELVSGSGRQALVSSGAEMLASLFGKDCVDMIGGAVSKYAGVDTRAAKGLIGMLAPVVMATLAQRKDAQDLDVAGLVKLLASQKDNISAAMPSGFAALLQGTGLLGALPAPDKPVSDTSLPSQPRREPGAAPIGGGRLPWVMGILLIALGAWYVSTGDVRRPPLPTPPQISVGDQNIGAQIGTLVERLQGTLTSLVDAASARTALPTLIEIGNQLEGIEKLRGQLAPAGKQSLAAYVASLLPLLRPMVDAALARSGVEPPLGPVLDQILNRLETMSKG